MRELPVKFAMQGMLRRLKGDNSDFDFDRSDAGDLAMQLSSARARIATLEREKAALQKQLSVPPMPAGTFQDPDTSASFTAFTPSEGSFPASMSDEILAMVDGGVRFSLTGRPVLPLVAPKLPRFAARPFPNQLSGVPPTSRLGSSRRALASSGDVLDAFSSPYSPRAVSVLDQRREYLQAEEALQDFALELEARFKSEKEIEQQREQQQQEQQQEQQQKKQLPSMQKEEAPLGVKKRDEGKKLQNQKLSPTISPPPLLDDRIHAPQHDGRSTSEPITMTATRKSNGFNGRGGSIDRPISATGMTASGRTTEHQHQGNKIRASGAAFAQAELQKRIGGGNDLDVDLEVGEFFL